MEFVPLHCHSTFSFHAGVAGVRDLVVRAKTLGLHALALTDTDRVSGLVRFYLECVEQGIKPILGLELTAPTDPQKHVVLLAKSASGYGNLCEIATRRHIEPGFSLETVFSRLWPDLFLVCSIPKLLETLNCSPNRANLIGELVNQSSTSRGRSRRVEDTCRALGLPVVATNNSYFLSREDHETHRILAAIGLNATLSRLKPSEVAPRDAFFRSGPEMRRAFPSHGQALDNTVQVANQCNVELDLGKWILPVIDVPEPFTPDTYLAMLAHQGLDGNFRATPNYTRAQELQAMELDVIAKLGYSSYFLFVKEIRDWGNRRFRSRYRTPTDCTILRGSAANSITFYNIGVSDLDPIRNDLYFQRFLNEDRASPPDADLDFAWDEREEVYDYIVNRWGQDRVAVTCTTNHFRQRAAFRETAKVYGYSEQEITRILVSQRTRTKRIEDRETAHILEQSRKIVGKPRFLGQHPGGIIITNEPIWRHVGCEYARAIDGGRLITQIDMHNVGRRIKLFSWPITERVHRVRRDGRNMLFITLEDKSECADVILWPDVYERYADDLVERGPLEIRGTVSEEWGTYSVEAEFVRAVPWSPAIIDFELAARRLEKSYDDWRIYPDIRRAGAA